MTNHLIRGMALLALASIASTGTARSGDELAGNSLEALRTDGARAVVIFGHDGTAHFTGAYQGDQWEEDGTYTVDKGRFCIALPEHGSECYAYPRKLVTGRPARLRSLTDPKMVAQFKLVKGHAAKLPAEGTTSF